MRSINRLYHHRHDQECVPEEGQGDDGEVACAHAVPIVQVQDSMSMVYGVQRTLPIVQVQDAHEGAEEERDVEAVEQHQHARDLDEVSAE
jgi:hypothetical protein